VPAKVLFVGLDACDVDLARDLAGHGRMPSLEALLREAVQIRTEGSPAGTYLSAIWATLATGLRVERHGYTCWKTIDPTTGDERPMDPTNLPVPPFWHALSDAGRRVALLDFPHTAPLQGINGMMISEWGTHERHFGFAAEPAAVGEELVDRFGRPPVAGLDHDQARQFSPCDWLHGGPFLPRDPAHTRALVRDLRAGLEMKAAASRSYLESGAWDLFTVVLGESHCAGHQFWHLHDRRHPYFTPSDAVLGDPLEEIYEQLDGVLADLIAAAGPDANVLVWLSHGMGPLYSATHLLDEVLARLESADSTRSARTIRAAKAAWHATPTRARRALGPLIARAARRRHVGEDHTIDVGPSERTGQRFYAFPNNDCVGAIRINLVGRESHGVVQAADYDAVCDELVRELSELVDLTTGRSIVRRVRRGIDVFGSADPPFADLYVDWTWEGLTNDVYSPTVGVLRRPQRTVRSGAHTPNGLLLARGPGITGMGAAGSTSVEHIAPSITRLLGVELTGIDGSALPAFAPRPPVPS
jgi:predicted AlkP superfamily phosphohydrolase/phosphomutase